mmetsp:Transcript_99412/g.264232  ORF Transcript_99412/g.264232 Transcript_99412/m.264232 type:complete len:231 (+) Transcript_99412:594-1286(+)
MPVQKYTASCMQRTVKVLTTRPKKGSSGFSTRARDVASSLLLPHLKSSTPWHLRSWIRSFITSSLGGGWHRKTLYCLYVLLMRFAAAWLASSMNSSIRWLVWNDSFVNRFVGNPVSLSNSNLSSSVFRLSAPASMRFWRKSTASLFKRLIARVISEVSLSSLSRRSCACSYESAPRDLMTDLQKSSLTICASGVNSNMAEKTNRSSPSSLMEQTFVVSKRGSMSIRRSTK